MGKPSTPPQPDYAKLIPEQEASNLRQFNTVLGASRPTSITPTGTTSWTRTPGEVNRSAYEEALASWKARGTAAGGTPGQWVQQPTGEWGGSENVWMPGAPGAAVDPGKMPTEDDFRGQDSWTMQQQLSPEEQQVFNADQQNRLSAQNAISTALGGLDTKPINMGSLPPGYSSDPGRLDKISDAIFNSQMRYARPEMDRQSRSLREDLLSQGFNFADDTAQDPMQRLRESQDKFTAQVADQATLGSRQEDSRLFDQSEGLRRNRLAELLTAQDQPIKILNALRTGAMPQTAFGTPQYSAPGLQGVDRVGAANEAYGNAIEASSARGAANSNFLSGLMGLIGTLYGGA